MLWLSCCLLGMYIADEVLTFSQCLQQISWHAIRALDGEINLDPLSGPELVHPGGTEHLPTHANIHFPMIENFVAAVLDGVPLLSSGESAIWTDWVTEQVYCPDAALFGSQRTSGTPSL